MDERELTREACKSLRGFADLTELQGRNADHAAVLFLKAAGAAAGLMIGRDKAAAALRMIARELVETEQVDQALAEIERAHPQRH